VLTAALKDTDDEIRRQAGRLLQSLGAEGRGAVPALLDAAKHAHGPTRAQALLALGAIDLAAPEVQKVLLTSLRDMQADVRQAAQQSLILGGRSVVPSLIAGLVNGEIAHRIQFIEILQKIGPEAKDATLALQDIVKDKDSSLRLKAILALRDIDAASPAAMQAFIDRFQDSDEEVRRTAQLAILTVPKPALQPLTAALQHNEVAIQRGAVEVLKKIAVEGQAKTEIRAAIGDVLLAMKAKDREVRDGAASTLAEFDPLLRGALPALKTALAQPQRSLTPSSIRSRTDFEYIPSEDLIRAIPSEPGARLKPILTELRCRHNEPVLVALTVATIHDDAEVQKLARTLLNEYLNFQSNPTEEKQAGNKLNLHKQLSRDVARDRYRQLIRDHPTTRVAEEARQLLNARP